VQGIKDAIPYLVKLPGSAGNLVVHRNDLGCECKKRHVSRFPFQIRISIDLVGQGIARNPLNGPVANQFEDLLHNPGFFANPRLVLIVREAIQAAGVEIYLHASQILSAVCFDRLYHSRFRDRIRHHVINLLLRIDPRWNGIPSDEASDLLEAYGVRRKPGLLQCAGSATIRVGGRDYLLEDFTPVAHLPDAWSDAWVEALASSGVQVVTTIENEYPFLSYVEAAGGPRGLGAQGEVAIYTAGFPTPALIIALRTLSERMPDLQFRHWGDADVGGLRIWWFLRCRLERPVSLFRTTATWVESEFHRGGRRLSTDEIEGLRRLKSMVVQLTNEDTESACELVDKLLEHGIKIEQERY